MSGTPIDILTRDGSIPVHRFEASSPGPLLVVMPSIFGLSPDVVAGADRFAHQGALVYVVDSFWREAPGPLRIPEDAPAAMDRKRSLDPEDAFSDLQAVIDAGLKDPDCMGPLLLLGICFGGKFVMRAAQNCSVKGLAVWHGSGLLPWISPSALIHTHMSLDFGADDPLIPLQEVERIRDQLDGHRVDIRVHPNAGHGFSHRGTRQCNEPAADAAVQGVMDLIAAAREERSGPQ